MENISKEYLLLFNAITDTAEALQALQLQLLAAQMRAESLFLGEAATPPVAFTQDKTACDVIS